MNKFFYLGFLPVHLFLLLAVFNISQVSLTLVVLFWVLLSGFGVGVALHRLLSHKSFKTYDSIKNLLSILSCFCIQGSPLFWVSVHRGYHHRFSDTVRDLHSPVHGKLSSYFLWFCKIDPSSISFRSAPDLLRSRLHIALSKYYFPIIWSGWILSYMLSPTVFFSLVIAQAITMHLEYCVNTWCHIDGIPGAYRNFDTKDRSQNYWLFGLLCWGIGYHNNHHHKPNDYNFGHTPREFDPTTLLVKMVMKHE